MKITWRSTQNLNEIFEGELNIEGTEKQIAYAESIIIEKLGRTDLACQNQISKGVMTKEQYAEGMKALMKQLETFKSAKYIIEHVK